ncbi:hypothetical protein H2199_008937 [Coniosporium tulheliwenetii]|uniref:Uncharacterized protein n=1 Tax=Coniosporium tulheliwenetii TaxID=3383036 RepID=A0ACC2YHB1_9PEZI|nr:hypothetical protein H2199_008937 [Cladosporium sp. JES 115]
MALQLYMNAYDYDSSTGTFVVRMPSVTHEAFCASVVDNITRQLAALSTRFASSRPDFSALITGIKHIGTPHITLEDPPSSDDEHQGAEVEEKGETKRSPDAVFAHSVFRHTAVVEVAGIRTVIGLDIEHDAKKGKEATVSVWYPAKGVDEDGEVYGFCEQVVTDQQFRSREGEAVAGELNLTVADLIPPAALKGITEDVLKDATITILHADLAAPPPCHPTQSRSSSCSYRRSSVLLFVHPAPLPLFGSELLLALEIELFVWSALSLAPTLNGVFGIFLGLRGCSGELMLWALGFVEVGL